MHPRYHLANLIESVAFITVWLYVLLTPVNSVTVRAVLTVWFVCKLLRWALLTQAWEVSDAE